jgi:hypothetical protein
VPKTFYDSFEQTKGDDQVIVEKKKKAHNLLYLDLGYHFLFSNDITAASRMQQAPGK